MSEVYLNRHEYERRLRDQLIREGLSYNQAYCEAAMETDDKYGHAVFATPRPAPLKMENEP